MHTATTYPAQVPTGHAHHFLSRLDRLPPPLVELALKLYRDQDLVDFILDQAHLPESAPRIALALGDTGRGPFLVLTRDGHFVTCLGEGMTAGELPVISRAQLDAYIARAYEMQARNEVLLGLGTPIEALFQRLVKAGDDLSREEIVALSASTPHHRARCVGLAAKVTRDLGRVRATVVPLVRRTKSPRPELHPTLRGYWQLAFDAGHFSVLAGVDGPGLLAQVPAILNAKGPMLSLLTMEQGIVSVALKGIWAAGQLDDELFAPYVQVLAASPCPGSVTDAILGITMIALRCQDLQGEAQAALEAHIGGAAGRDELTVDLCRMALEVMREPERFLAAHRAHGARLLVEQTRNLPQESPWRFTRVEDVPEDLAMTAAVRDKRTFFAAPGVLEDMIMMLPWLAEARAQDLYFPGDLARALHVRWRPADTMALLEGHCWRAPAARPDAPSRGGPCPCKSGKKFKRCCGDERRGGELPKAA